MGEKAKQQQETEQKANKKRKLLCKSHFLTFYQESIPLENKEILFDFIEHPGAVGILPIQDNGNLLFIRQWRRATNTILLEIPAGRLEQEETPEKCADRELREETGFQAGRLTRLGGIYTAPGFCNEFVHLFIGEDLSSNPLWADDTDHIDLVSLSLKEVLFLAKSGKITDAKTLAILLLYQQAHHEK